MATPLQPRMLPLALACGQTECTPGASVLNAEPQVLDCRNSNIHLRQLIADPGYRGFGTLKPLTPMSVVWLSQVQGIASVKPIRNQDNSKEEKFVPAIYSLAAGFELIQMRCVVRLDW